MRVQWIKDAAAFMCAALGDKTNEATVYQLNCMYGNVPSLFLASNKCLVQIQDDREWSDGDLTTISQLTDTASIAAATTKGTLAYNMYTDAKNPFKACDEGILDKVFLGINRFCSNAVEYVDASLFSSFDTIIINADKLFAVDRHKKTATWLALTTPCDEAIAAADPVIQLLADDVINNYDIGFVSSGDIVVAAFKHKKLPIKAWIPLIYFSVPMELEFNLNGKTYEVTGFGDKTKPYAYEHLKEKGESKMAELKSLADISAQLGIVEKKADTVAQETKPLVNPDVAAAVCTQVAAPVEPVVETPAFAEPAPVEPEPVVQEPADTGAAPVAQESVEPPKQQTAIEMLQELAEEIDSLINLNNTLVKQWPKKVKAINRALAAESKARALDPKIAKRLEDLEADSAKLKKIMSTLGL